MCVYLYVCIYVHTIMLLHILICTNKYRNKQPHTHAVSFFHRSRHGVLGKVRRFFERFNKGPGCREPLISCSLSLSLAHSLSLSLSIDIYTYTHTYIHTYMLTYRLGAHTHQAHICICSYACTYVCRYMNMCTYVYNMYTETE